jgi:multidrug efflux pump subunit AcrA (membrane-fusion protein)
MKRVSCYIAFVALVAVSCSSQKKEDDSENVEAAKASFVSERNIVDTIHLKRTDFNRQVITNGKLRAVAKSVLAFPVSGTLQEILVKNGQYVNKDGVIARLDPTPALNKLSQSRQSMERSELSFMNDLIGYGYGRDTSKIPAEIVKVVRLKSGYNDALFNLRQAEEELVKTELRAPFAGKVANISVKPYETVSGVFCTLIDDRRFEVMFSLLESEVSFIKVGNTVQVALYSDSESLFKGVITQINPIVDEKGQIAVTAEIANSSGKLIEGMNVKVIAESLLKNKLVVPKSAVVMRDNFDVLFRIDKERNRSMWTYVKVEMSNSQYHVVVPNKEKNAELNEGDVIIVSGNLNLAEGSNVEIKNR